MSKVPPAACDAAAFERRYRQHADPWNFAHSTYERRRYDIMLETLTRDRYETAYEPGCSIGEFTALLARRCECVLASDLSATAVAAARRRCAAHSNAIITVGSLPADVPEGDVDLIVFSEIGYYFSARQLRRIASLLHARLRPQGELMAVHWLGKSIDHALHGDEVGQILIQTLGQRQAQRRIENAFRIDLWRRP